MLDTQLVIKQSDFHVSIDGLVNAWLDAKSKRSGSAATFKAYSNIINGFRDTLGAMGLDLDGDPKKIRIAAQGWSSLRQSSLGEGAISASTYNTRLAVISSFYEYAKRNECLDKNPIENIDRRPVQGYANSRSLDLKSVGKQLNSIDRTTNAGLRDHAIISIALATGRRSKEVVSMKIGDLSTDGEVITIHFPRCKGGKQMTDRLDPRVSKTLHNYLYKIYGPNFALMRSAPVWVSFSRRNNYAGITSQTLADICKKRLGTSKVHALRHTFAHGMEHVGAKISDIQARLGHSSLQTTGRYLASLSSSINPQSSEMADLLGL